MGLFCSAVPAVGFCQACRGAGSECCSPAEPDRLRDVSLLPVLQSSNLLQDIDFKVCCAGLTPASNRASDMFKQIMDILFTQVFRVPYPSPVIFPQPISTNAIPCSDCVSVRLVPVPGRSRLVSAPEGS